MSITGREPTLSQQVLEHKNEPSELSQDGLTKKQTKQLIEHFEYEVRACLALVPRLDAQNSDTKEESKITPVIFHYPKNLLYTTNHALTEALNYGYSPQYFVHKRSIKEKESYVVVKNEQKKIHVPIAGAVIFMPIDYVPDNCLPLKDKLDKRNKYSETIKLYLAHGVKEIRIYLSRYVNFSMKQDELCAAEKREMQTWINDYTKHIIPDDSPVKIVTHETLIETPSFKEAANHFESMQKAEDSVVHHCLNIDIANYLKQQQKTTSPTKEKPEAQSTTSNIQTMLCFTPTLRSDMSAEMTQAITDEVDNLHAKTIATSLKHLEINDEQLTKLAKFHYYYLIFRVRGNHNKNAPTRCDSQQQSCAPS